jgi:hypothetical protein
MISFLAATAATASAQARPDFTGTWIRAAEGAPTVATTGDAGFRIGDMGSGWGTPLTITQRADSLIVAYVFFGSYDLQPPIRLAYALDGSSSLTRIMIGHATTAVRTGITRWTDSSVMISSQYPVPSEARTASDGATILVSHTLRLVSPTSLVIETTRPGVGGAPATIQTAYTRR